MKTVHAHIRPARRVAFTLAELLVVISLVVILIAIAVPSFASLLASQERTQAENQLRVGIAGARDAALRASVGRDAAAVFFFNPRTGRTRIVPCVQVGTIQDVRPNGSRQNPDDIRERDVFVPVATESPLELPAGWTARGYAPPGTVDTNGTTTGWYSGGKYVELAGNWVFPETGFADFTDPRDGRERSTFMVRFEGGTGGLAVGSTGDAIVVDLSPRNSFRTTAPFSRFRLDQSADLAADVRRMVSPRPDFDEIQGNPQELLSMLGWGSIDVVLARPLTQIALTDERRLAPAIGASGLNRVTNSLYGNATGTIPDSPTIDSSLFRVGGTPGAVVKKTNDYIEGRGNAPSEARVFTMDRYSGQLRELEP
jgi:type II secretory pathway pseudopilin PulG